MNIGIDASNISSGGGLLHLENLVNNINCNDNIKEVVVWGSNNTLSKLKSSTILNLSNHTFLNKSLFYRAIWKIFILKNEIEKTNCDILLVPDGIYIGKFHPFVVISQNMLIFQRIESSRYHFSLQRFRYLILNLLQSRIFKKADGIIYVSKYSQNYINSHLSIQSKPSAVIYYGNSDNIKFEKKSQKEIYNFNHSNPFRILYLSPVDVYKHQWNIVEAVSNLYHKGLPLKLILIGTSNKMAYKKLNRAIKKFDSNTKIIDYLGFVCNEEKVEQYKKADLFIFASTCESMPNILVEAMSSGLPIACSSYGPMPEVLGEAGLYFDPLDIHSIEESLTKLFLNKES